MFLTVGVADAVEVGHDFPALVRDLHPLVDGHEPAPVRFDVHGVQAEAGGVRRAARGDQHGVDLELVDDLFGLEVGELDLDRLHAGDAGGHLRGQHARVPVDAAGVDQQPLREARDLPVEAGHQVVHRLDEGHLAAQGRVDVGELEADVAAADDGDPLGDPLELERVVGREDGLSVDGDPGRDEGDGAGRDHDVAGGDGAPDVDAAGQGVLDLVGA